MAAPQQVLTYYDVQLYDSDVALFANAQWLNDNAIHFFFEFLFRTLCVAPSQQLQQQHEVGNDSDLNGAGSSSDVLFVDPAVVSCMMLQCDDDDEFADLGAGLGVQHKQLCFIPVNDNEAFGGDSTHWSLLVYRTATHNFAHYDSSAGHNTRAAKRIASTFEKMLRLSGAALPRQPAAFTSVSDAPQQRNGYDCGMYVLVVAEFLCREYVGRFDADAPRELSAFATPEVVTQTRRTMPKLIRRLQLAQHATA